jgi:hypothetical protein
VSATDRKLAVCEGQVFTEGNHEHPLLIRSLLLQKRFELTSDQKKKTTSFNLQITA